MLAEQRAVRRVIHDEVFFEFVEHLNRLFGGRNEESGESQLELAANHRFRFDAHDRRCQLEKCLGADRGCVGYVPSATERATVERETHECFTEVDDVGVRVECVRVAEQLGFLAVQQRIEEAFANDRRCGMGPEEVRRSARGRLQTAGLVFGFEGAPQIGASLAFASGGDEWQRLGERSGDRAVAVEVLHRNEHCVGAAHGANDAVLQRGKLLGPAVIPGLRRLVHGRRAGDDLGQVVAVHHVGGDRLRTVDLGAASADDDSVDAARRKRPNNRMGHRARAENDVPCHALTSEETTGLRAGKKRQASSDPRIATMPTVVHAA